mgnify:CR=1 FL=1
MTTNLSCTGCIHLSSYHTGEWCSANNEKQAPFYRLISVEKQLSDAGRCGPERVLYKQDLFGKFLSIFQK